MLEALDLKFALIGAEELKTKAAGFVAGIASTSALDRGNDIVAPGAFTASIAERGFSGVRGIKFLWQHDPREPVGNWTKMEQRDAGLYVEGQFDLESETGKKGYHHAKSDQSPGLSIGFRTKRREYNEDTGARTVLEGDLWEVSQVTFPMNEQAQIVTLKSMPIVFEDGDDVASVAKKFALHHHLSRREADAAIDALKAAMREDPELKALKAALGIAPKESVQRTDAKTAPDPQAYAPALAAFSRIAQTIRSGR